MKKRLAGLLLRWSYRLAPPPPAALPPTIPATLRGGPLRREAILRAAAESGLARTVSCCEVGTKLCAGDEWRGNLEGFASALLRRARHEAPAGAV